MTRLLDSLSELPADAILSLMVAFRDDPAARKVDLTMGVYKDRSGKTHVMQAIVVANAGVGH